MAAGQRGDDGGDGSSRRSRKRTERANYSSFEVQGSTSSDSNLDRLQRKWRDTVQKQQEMRRRASEVEKRYDLDDDSASAAAKDWEDVEDPRKTNSMRARSLRISAKLRQSLARRRRRPTSAPEGKEKRKLMVRFADQVTVRSYEVPQEEEEDVEEEQQDDAASYSLNGEMVLGGPKSPGMSRGHTMMAQQAGVVDGDEFGSVVPDETCALSDRARDLSKKQRRRSKRRNKNSKRVRSPEYTREAEFFDMIQDWCRRELTDVSYEGASIQEFLPRKRASVARDHHIETYAELVRKCKRFVDNEIYEPSSLEQDSSTFAIHTEEIIARYSKYFRALKQQLEEEFGDDVKVVGQEDPGTTGNFEVTLTETGDLLHSKSTRGQGKCQSAAEVQAIVDKIQDFLDSKE
ncbi:Selenoprotein W [Hondaea fermentalgiana]|uniref:Selenoprotein W n=1 Tax=Hondaea fermentalgiana TaxID=2315210 RepID=A0A2R5GI96_9STRA|nr:Selenoprotein W [Hondaea fermentalgiana]|eukprot:GBG30620.1 Selenoprotein W [Hondaea fermentalgiana]